MIELIEFEQALAMLKQGLRIRRMIWPDNEFLFLLHGGFVPITAVHDENLRQVLTDQGHVTEDGYFKAKASIRKALADCSIMTGWVPSQVDMFADDWIVVP